MKECFSCHQEIGDVTFCGHCGERQDCEECGMQFERLSAFCLNCGTKREANSEDEEHKSQTSAHLEEQPTETDQPVAGALKQEPPQQAPVQQGEKNDFVESMKQHIQKLGKRNLYIIGGILVVLIAFFIYQGSNDRPEKVVENFFQAMSDGDIEKIEEYVNPIVWKETVEYEVIESIEFLNELDVTIELLNLVREDTGEDYIDFEATVKFDSVFLDEEDEDMEIVTVEVTQHGN